MKKTFIMENDVGIEVKYTVLGVLEEGKVTYVVYTSFMPSDNELGYRLLAGELLNTDPIEVKRITRVKEKEITEAFKLELIKNGMKIKR